MTASNIYLPQITEILDIRQETPDVKTFNLRFKNKAYHESFAFKPGQFVEASVFGVGEAPFGFASSPFKKDFFEITLRAMGTVTNAMHKLKKGDEIGIRAPLGNNFPFEESKGMNVLFIGGGIGLPPLRSLINAILDNREDFEKITILYGARTPSDRVYKNELTMWSKRDDIEFYETVDVADETWTGNVGVVTTLFSKIKVDLATTVAFTCGPPIMIKFVIQDLLRLGFAPERIVSTLERNMKCGVGKCGHCCIGHKYVCVDGPVFNYKQIEELAEKP